VGEVEKLLAEEVVEYIQVLLVVDKVLELEAVEQLLVEEVVDNILQVVEESYSLLQVADIHVEPDMILLEVSMRP
jgi:dihydroneopterin aldolase